MSELNVEAFLGAIDLGTAWTRQIFLNGVPVQMKLDTGADVTTIQKLPTGKRYCLNQV